eukprot:m.300554 g.300554  ORF g.300554 m.300554 type:complete len:168 (+) comp20129_c0_seq9:1679-2182(+)
MHPSPVPHTSTRLVGCTGPCALVVALQIVESKSMSRADATWCCQSVLRRTFLMRHSDPESEATDHTTTEHGLQKLGIVRPPDSYACESLSSDSIKKRNANVSHQPLKQDGQDGVPHHNGAPSPSAATDAATASVPHAESHVVDDVLMHPPNADNKEGLAELGFSSVV